MSKEITINKQTLQVKQYNGQNVVTFKDIDLCHERREGTASRNFRANKRHFIEGTDYFKISPDEFRRTIGNMDKRQNNEVFLITESGYYMIVKSFTDELSWVVQRELVNTYFKYKEEPAALVPQKPYEYFDKTWKGEPVLTARDIQHMTGIFRTTVVSWMKSNGTILLDYYVLTGRELMKFKAENPRIGKSVRALYVITKNGFNSLCRAHGIKTDEPKCFEEFISKAPWPNGIAIDLLCRIERSISLVDKHRKEMICSANLEDAHRAKMLLIYAANDIISYVNSLKSTTV